MQVDNTAIRSGAVVPMVAVISNPKSTTNAEGLGKVRNLVRSSANVVHFELDSMEAVDEALALFARANPAVLVINGGDGTVGLVLAALLYRNPFPVVPPIAILPGGKTNMTAADLGMRRSPEKCLSRVLKVVRSGDLQDRLVSRNVIELDMGDGTPVKVGTFFGAAGVVKAINWCRENAYSRGLPNWAAHMLTIATFFGAILGIGRNKDLLTSDHMTVRVKGSAIYGGRFSFVAISTLDKLLMGARPFGTTGFGGLRFSAVLSGGKIMVRGFLGLLTGAFGKGKLDGISVGKSDDIEVVSSDPVTLDGEIYLPKPGTVMKLSGKKTLTFVKL